MPHRGNGTRRRRRPLPAPLPAPPPQRMRGRRAGQRPPRVAERSQWERAAAARPMRAAGAGGAPFKRGGGGGARRLRGVRQLGPGPGPGPPLLAVSTTPSGGRSRPAAARDPPALVSALALVASAVPGERNNGAGWACRAPPRRPPRCGTGSVSRAAAARAGLAAAVRSEPRDCQPPEPSPARAAEGAWVRSRARRRHRRGHRYGSRRSSCLWPLLRVPGERGHHAALCGGSLITDQPDPGAVAAPFGALQPAALPEGAVSSQRSRRNGCRGAAGLLTRVRAL